MSSLISNGNDDKEFSSRISNRNDDGLRLGSTYRQNSRKTKIFKKLIKNSSLILSIIYTSLFTNKIADGVFLSKNVNML
jgi:hypothetical protein